MPIIERNNLFLVKIVPPIQIGPLTESLMRNLIDTINLQTWIIEEQTNEFQDIQEARYSSAIYLDDLLAVIKYKTPELLLKNDEERTIRYVKDPPDHFMTTGGISLTYGWPQTHI
jgi:hypothetical protein